MPNDTIEDGPILLFDGVCHLCNRIVRFTVARDPAAKFRFAPLQSEVGRELLERHGLQTDTMDTFVMVDGDDCYTRSRAALEVARRLPFPWPLLHPLRLVPRPIRDAVYGYVARHRYDWFGTYDACPAPPPDLADRFL